MVVLLAVMAEPGQPQTTAKHLQPQFEVASIRVSKGNIAAPVARITPGRFGVENMTLRRLIIIAYRVQNFQISNGPRWIDSEHYNIQAETSGQNGVDTMLVMLQGLLEDRFHLRYHHEMREGHVYLLTAAKNGSKLRAANCIPFDPNNLIKQSHLPAEARISQCGGISRTGETLDGNGMSMKDGAGPPFQSLAGQLTLLLDRPVIDRTGLTGRFDVHLRWSSDRVPTGTRSDSDDPGSRTIATDATGPSIFTAVQEQLGLKLEAGTGPMDEFVIDHVEMPSEN